jgi:hypothetical protein
LRRRFQFRRGKRSFAPRGLPCGLPLIPFGQHGRKFASCASDGRWWRRRLSFDPIGLPCPMRSNYRVCKPRASSANASCCYVSTRTPLPGGASAQLPCPSKNSDTAVTPCAPARPIFALAAAQEARTRTQIFAALSLPAAQFLNSRSFCRGVCLGVICDSRQEDRSMQTSQTSQYRRQELQGLHTTKTKDLTFPLPAT